MGINSSSLEKDGCVGIQRRINRHRRALLRDIVGGSGEWRIESIHNVLSDLGRASQCCLTGAGFIECSLRGMNLQIILCTIVDGYDEAMTKREWLLRVPMHVEMRQMFCLASVVLGRFAATNYSFRSVVLSCHQNDIEPSFS